jgi:hypothetical protein
MAQDISLVISVGFFGFVVGFLTGYSIRAYLSNLQRKRRHQRDAKDQNFIA